MQRRITPLQILGPRTRAHLPRTPKPTAATRAGATGALWRLLAR